MSVDFFFLVCYKKVLEITAKVLTNLNMSE